MNAAAARGLTGSLTDARQRTRLGSTLVLQCAMQYVSGAPLCAHSEAMGTTSIRLRAPRVFRSELMALTSDHYS